MYRPFFALVLSALLAIAACAGDPVEQLEAARAHHRIRVQSFVVRDDPAAGGTREIVLDVLLERDGRDVLPGLTVEVSMADPTGAEKAHRRAWLDASKLGAGGLQTEIVLDDVPYAPGDGFFVEVRSPIPAAERSEYREFGELAGISSGATGG